MKNFTFFLGSIGKTKYTLFSTPLGFVLAYTLDKKTASLFTEVFETFEDAISFFTSIKAVRNHAPSYKQVVLAKDLYLRGFSEDWTECMVEAYMLIDDVDCKVVTSVKKDKSISTRVVASWADFNVVKGTGKAIKKGLRLFTDVAKLVAYNGQKSYTFSCYAASILYLV